MLSSSRELPVRKWPQYLIAFLSNLGVLLFGLQAAWLAPLQPLFQSKESPIGNGEPLTNEEISWIAALPSITLVLGSPLYGYFLDKFGRRFSSLLVCVPNILCYGILIFAKNVYLVYLARLLGGLGASGGFVVTPIYVGETAEEETRGLLGSLSGTAIKIGMIVSYIISSFAPYLITNITGFVVSIIFVFFYFWLPESPAYSYYNVSKEQAIRDIQKLRGKNELVLEQELTRIKSAKDRNENFKLRTLLKDPWNVKAMIILNGIVTIQMLSGYPAIIRYSVNIFQSSGTSVSPYWSAIVLAISQLLSALAGAVLVDTIGRKALLLYSTIIMVIGLSSMSFFMYFKDLSTANILRFTPSISLILFIIGYGAAYGSVPFVIVPDLFVPAARATAAAVENVTVSFFEFVVTKCFPTVTELIGLEGSFLIFAVFGTLGVFFIKFVMFETKDLNKDLKDDNHNKDVKVVDKLLNEHSL